MNVKIFCSVLVSVFCALGVQTAAAQTGTTLYAVTNCYVFETSDGLTLFERSGGDGVKVGEKVVGTLDDYGYQSLKNSSGKEVLVGFVQDLGITDPKMVAEFKKNCR